MYGILKTNFTNLTNFTNFTMSKLNYKIHKQVWNARVGEITLNGVTLKTPVFMPVGTKATIKWLSLDYMQNPSMLGTRDPINMILSNTYHLYLRPGTELLKQAGWVHKFMQRDKLLLTDSWGFQVFSLGLSQNTKSGKPLVKLYDHGVDFRSIHDGSKHTFTPTWVVDTQNIFWSDIMMMLDVCSPVDNITKKEVASQMALTHSRAKMAYDYHISQYDESKWVLFPIVQWGLYDDLREESAKTLAQYATDGIAIWWLSVWETKSEMKRVLEHTVPHLPADKPRYLMWVGTPEDIRMAVAQGIDMFDCVLPTRLGRHGTAFWPDDTYIKLRNAQYRDDHTPLMDECRCNTCRTYTKAYLHHLIREDEMMWGILLSFHNIARLHQLVEKLRDEMMTV